MIGQAEIGGLKQVPPFRYLDGLVDGDPVADSLEGFVEFQGAQDRFYAASLSNTLLIEALAQLSGVLVRRKTGLTSGGFLTAIERAWFFQQRFEARPILLRAQLKQVAFPHFTLDTLARQDGRALCSCTLSARVNTGNVQ